MTRKPRFTRATLLMVTQAPDIFKEALFDLALAGKPRPKKNARDALERRLAQRLVDYTRTGSPSRDDAFAKRLYSLRPDWIRGTEGKESRLLKLAKSGGPRPTQRSPSEDERSLANALIQLTGPTTSRYDPEFTTKIKRLRPDWFADKKDGLYARILIRAKKGLPRPKRTSEILLEQRMAELLNHSPEQVRERDRKVLLALRRLRPDWFENSGDVKRRRLLELARLGGERPSRLIHKTGEMKTLAITLSNLHAARHEKAAAAFLKELRRLAPHWFKRWH